MKRGLLAVLALALAAAGIALLAWSYMFPTYEDAPLPAAPYSVSDPQPQGPTAAPIERGSQIGAVMSPGQMRPLHVFIPTLGVYAPLSAERQSSNGMTLPDDVSVVGHNTSAAALDAKQGTVLMAGHVTFHRQEGALHDLYAVPLGSRVYVTDGKGTVREYVVGDLGTVIKSSLPQGFFSRTGDPRLVLVTCGGPVTKRGEYWIHRDNVYAIAYPVAQPVTARTDAGTAG